MHCTVLCLVALVALMAGVSVTTASFVEPGRVGCFEDNKARVWKQWENRYEIISVRSCKHLCQDFKYAGMEAGTVCVCGDDIPPTRLPDSRCDRPCTGNQGQTCGGGWALEVYTVEPEPELLGKSMGCFLDSADRVWKTGLIKLQSNSPERCFNACRSFKYAGMEAGTWCVCGNTLPPTPLPRSRCQTECSGYPGKKCGGDWALDVFELNVAPSPVQVLGCPPMDYQARGDMGVYKLYTQRKTWDEAWQQCEDDDAHLLIINSEDEAKFVRSLFAHVPSETRMHAGFHDLLRKGTYRTLFGEPLSSTGYTVWSSQHAQAHSAVQHCGCVDVRAQLAQIDGNCAAHALFVCEKKSESPDANGHAVQFDVRSFLGAHDQ